MKAQCKSGFAAAVAVFAVLALEMGACSTQRIELGIGEPRFAALLEGLDISGEVRVYRDGARTTLARADLEIDGAVARARLPALPSGEDLNVRIFWRSDSLSIAESGGRTVRLDGGGNKKLSFSASDYVYPDVDGDGANNLFELIYENDNPNEAAGAVSNPRLFPRGFFSQPAGVIALPGAVAFQAEVRSLGSLAMVGTMDIEGTMSRPEYVNQAVDFIHVPTRERHSVPLDCTDQEPLFAVRLNGGGEAGVVAASCGAKVHYLLADHYLGVVEDTTQIGVGQIDYLVFSASGQRLYAVDLFRGEIHVMYSGIGTPRYGLIETLDADVLGDGVLVHRLVDTGSRLIVLDPGHEGLIVLSHVDDANHVRIASPLRGQLNKPADIVLHPSGDIAYIANLGDGLLRVVDISANDPNQWSIIGAVAISTELSSLAIEPVYGYWLYAVADRAFARINTISLAIEQRFDIAGDDASQLMHVALSEDGAFGVVVASGAIMPLGNPASPWVEEEPNNTVAQAAANRAVVGPPPSTSVGFADMREDFDSSVRFVQTVYNGLSPVEFEEDIEDLWRLDVGNAARPLVLAVFPAMDLGRMSISLVTAQGEVTETAIFPLQATSLTPGTGVFMITDPAEDLPAGLSVGINATDFDRTSNYTPYEIVAKELGNVTTILEVERDYSVDPQFVAIFPSVVEGLAEASDEGAYVGWGSEDAEDCYLVDVATNRLGIRLDFADDVDLDLTILNLDGARMLQQYGLVGLGLAEHFVFEPHLRDKNFLVCVTIEDGIPPASAPYTITFVDFDI
ncbi:MAG: hypothetical protein A2289_09730 [Deltaproteobacteria bacterium RIFOXYA12_FULL_58_15]|nr:MAG: hypothetical protein A2289_09730 [Deltaproteobacteria bacterium RIFOXYA12_FULL_58_15]OGR08756.1 MAG: hypothetical protein A2341_13740 [Deltaproteobacteria bacterium RIFOXYB12_FULL_58_9]